MGAVDCDGSANSPIDQVSIDKANVPLENFAAALDQPIPDVGYGGGSPCDHPHHLATPQVLEPARLDTNVVLCGEDGLLLPGNEEVGTEAVVLHQEGLAALQPAEELHDGPVFPDPVGRLEDEPACIGPCPALRPSVDSQGGAAVVPSRDGTGSPDRFVSNKSRTEKSRLSADQSWMRASSAQLDTIQISQDSSPSPWPSSGGDPISSGWSGTAPHRRLDRPEPVE